MDGLAPPHLGQSPDRQHTVKPHSLNQATPPLRHRPRDSARSRDIAGVGRCDSTLVSIRYQIQVHPKGLTGAFPPSRVLATSYRTYQLWTSADRNDRNGGEHPLDRFRLR